MLSHSSILYRAYLHRWWLLFVLALVLLASRAEGASAHASLIRSDPEAGAVLRQPPQSVQLFFSEAIDPSFFEASLVDADNRTLVVGPGQLDAADPEVLQLELPELLAGSYTVLWQVRSAVDGHITSGGVPFAVGADFAPASALPQPGAARPATETPPLADSLARWVNFLAAVLLVGPLVFGLLVWKPAYRARAVSQADDLRAQRTLRRLALAGAVGMALGALLLIYLQAALVAQEDASLSFASALGQLLAGRSGRLLLARLALAGLVALLVRRLPQPGTGAAQPWVLSALAGLAALLAITLGGHSAALDSPLAIAADWIHLAAMATWVGGLLPLLLLIRSAEPPLIGLVPRFSRLALVSVAALAGTGLYLAYRQVGSWEALSLTTYGRVLSVKVLLVAGLLALGGANLLLLSPRLAAKGGQAVRWLRKTVRGEILLAGLALLATGVMAGAAPSREALEAERRLGYVGSFREEGRRVTLWVAPGKPGYNEIAVDLSRFPGGSTPAGLEVLFQLEMMDHEMGITQVTAAPAGEGRYSVAGSHLAMAGNWRIEVILRQPGANDLRHSFDIQLDSLPQVAVLENPVPADEYSVHTGQSLYQRYCVPCHGVTGAGDGPSARAMNPPPADLTQHAIPGVHPDGQLFDWISNGYPGSQMPSFAEVLSEEEIWHLVNYLRVLAEAEQ